MICQNNQKIKAVYANTQINLMVFSDTLWTTTSKGSLLDLLTTLSVGILFNFKNDLIEKPYRCFAFLRLFYFNNEYKKWRTCHYINQICFSFFIS